ncbi:hypothetical protein INR49_030952 [Caranx melampygus]|nr:hypothetical protein INR49_030952 [Caranx melampygus]
MDRRGINGVSLLGQSESSGIISWPMGARCVAGMGGADSVAAFAEKDFQPTVERRLLRSSMALPEKRQH